MNGKKIFVEDGCSEPDSFTVDIIVGGFTSDKSYSPPEIRNTKIYADGEFKGWQYNGRDGNPDRVKLFVPYNHNDTISLNTIGLDKNRVEDLDTLLLGIERPILKRERPINRRYEPLVHA
jgi:hypothetical protein